jgi:hypothetical protein
MVLADDRVLYALIDVQSRARYDAQHIFSQEKKTIEQQVRTFLVFPSLGTSSWY